MRDGNRLNDRWIVLRLPHVGPVRRSIAVILSILTALLLAGATLAAAGYSPTDLLRTVLIQQFGTPFGLEDFGLIYAPIVFCGLATALCLHAGLWNIGAEGQFYAGAVVATGIGLFVPGPGWLIWPLLLLGGLAGGMAWIAVPALARVFGAVDEIISTLLLNFVAILLVTYLASQAWRDQTTFVNTGTARVPYNLPMLSGVLHIGIVIAIVLALILAAALRYSRWGYEVSFCGSNPEAAAYAGMPVKRRLLQVMLVSGAVAGLAGMLEIVGTVHRLQTGISSSYAYLGIIAAVLVRGSMPGVLLSGGLTATLLGATSILQSQGITASVALALTGGILLFSAMGSRLAEFRLQRVAVSRPQSPSSAAMENP